MVLHFRAATSVFRKTMPFVLLRLGIGVLFGVLTIAYFGFVFWVGNRLLDAGTISSGIAGIGLVLSIVLFVGAWRLFSRYVLYLIKTAHIAVIVHVVETGEVPDEQIAFGKDQVTAHFREASALFVVDQLVKSVIKQFNGAVVSVSSLLEFVPSLKNILKLLTKAVAIAASYIDEAIVAHMFRNPDQNKWRSARDGVVLYGKNWKPVLGSTLVIVLGMYAVGFVLLLGLSPLASVLGGLSTTVEVLGWIVVGGVVLTVHTGLLKPWVKTVVITTFLVESRGDSPDSDTIEWIESRSSKFRELMGKAEASGSDGRHEPVDDETPATVPGRKPS